MHYNMLMKLSDEINHRIFVHGSGNDGLVQINWARTYGILNVW
jgi:hypothetical protein